jgi:HD-GYP domain-containing protein (c-di-GMP phosphodiesterase class II)
MFEPTNVSVLVFDPHHQTRSTLVKFLSAHFECDSADSHALATEKVSANKHGVIVADLDGEDAIEFVSTAQFLSPEASIILVSKNESSRFIVDAFRGGASDVLLKPFELDELEESVIRAAAKTTAAKTNANYCSGLKEEIELSKSQLKNTIEGVENSYGVTLKALIQALETRDAETHGHSERVVTFSLRLASEVGLDKDQRRDLELGAMLHDIGKIGVPDSILRKPAKLNQREWAKMKQHPIQGSRILRGIPFLEGAAKVVLQHHERWDGTGYPNNLRGNEIDITARVFAVADAFDAMTSDRVYSRGKSFKEAFTELKKCAGSQFDPEVVEAFNSIPAEDWEVLHKRSLHEKPDLFSFQDIVDELTSSQNYFEMVH